MSEMGRRWMSQHKQREQICPSSAFFFCSGPQWIEWHHQNHWWRLSLLSLAIQTLISSRDTLTEIPRNDVLPAIWASLSSIMLTYKINHHWGFPSSSVLRSPLCVKETQVQSLVQENSTGLRATKPMCHNYWACAPEPRSHNYWVHVL